MRCVIGLLIVGYGRTAAYFIPLVIPSISIILPVYNAGEHLLPCMESLLAQTYPDFELIVVLDCPTDGSAEQVLSLAQRDARIQVVSHHENAHIGRSRNDGLAEAKGDYVTFVDHDDICSPFLLERLYAEAMQCNADVVLSPIIDCPNAEQALDFESVLAHQPASSPLPNAGLRSADKVLRDTLSRGGADEWEGETSVVLGALFRRSLAQRYAFVDTRRCSAEDWLFLVEVLHEAERVSWLKEPFYAHLRHGKNEGSSLRYTGALSRSEAIDYLAEKVSQWQDAGEWILPMKSGISKQVVRLLPPLWQPFTFLQQARIYRSQEWFPELFDSRLLPRPHGLLGKIYRQLVLVFLQG